MKNSNDDSLLAHKREVDAARKAAAIERKKREQAAQRISALHRVHDAARPFERESE